MTKILGWVSGLNIQGKIGIFFLGLGLVAIAIVTAVHFVDAAFESSEQKGAAVERAESHGKVIQNVEQANEARAAVRDERGRAAYDECVRSARNPANCERFLPQ